jgi:hypothetical protein
MAAAGRAGVAEVRPPEKTPMALLAPISNEWDPDFNPHDPEVTDAERARYYGRKANALTARCNQQHGTQEPLPFPEMEDQTRERE